MAIHHSLHIRPPRVCSPPLLGSEVLGFYLVPAKGEPTAIFELHSFGGSLSGPWHNIYYTGPGKNALSALEHKRTRDDDQRFDSANIVDAEIPIPTTTYESNDTKRGGFAALFHSRKRRSFDVWLFGPLLFLGKPYGSLVIELAHYAERTIFTKRNKDWSVKQWAEFGPVPAGFNHCKVMQTPFYPHVGEGGGGDSVDPIALRAVRANGLPLVPLGRHSRVEWKVISRTIGQTNCQLYEQEGV